jgi:hypothetical protein
MQTVVEKPPTLSASLMSNCVPFWWAMFDEQQQNEAIIAGVMLSCAMFAFLVVCIAAVVR